MDFKEHGNKKLLNILKKYNKNNIFIESGSYLGDGIICAYNSNMFRQIHSIEIKKNLYDRLCKKFKPYKNINLYLGDSGELIGDIIKDINEGITFWLDGHFSGGITGTSKKYESPIVKELISIHKNIKNNKNALIIIDDINFFSNFNILSLENMEKGYCTKEILIKLLKKINNNFKIEFINYICVASTDT